MKKFLPHILILAFILLVGVFTPFASTKVLAEGGPQGSPCTMPNGDQGVWTSTGTGGPNGPNTVCVVNLATNASLTSTNGLENNLPSCAPGFFGILSTGTIGGCIVHVFYFLFFAIPSFLLVLTARLFDAMLPLTLSSVMYTQSSFIPEAWRIVRDFSNIFFILALLYTAIKVILSIDTAGVKKAVVNIVIAALLINFSMFMTQIVIDSSNILALIFYNKINVKIENAQNIHPVDREPVFDPAKTGVETKGISYAMVSSFNPTRLMDKEIFSAAKGEGGFLSNFQYGVFGETFGLGIIKDKGPNIVFYLTLIFVSCAIFLVASYAFFIATLAFFGRLIELWMLIIFSPFAFMSLSSPKLQSLEYLGFDAWLKRLLSVAFMAPIFMFFMLLISKLIQINPIANLTSGEITKETVDSIQFYILMIIPTMISLALLLKAVKFAKEGSGQFGELIIKYGQMAAAAVGGLAIGAATGGVGLAATATLGRAGASLATSSVLKTSASQGGLSGLGAKALMNLGSFASKSSFDARKIGVVGKTMGKMGMSAEPSAITKALGLSTEGGVVGMRKRKEEKDIERANEIGKVGDHEQVAIDLRQVENAHQDLLLEEIDDGTGRMVSISHRLEQLDKALAGANEASTAANRALAAAGPAGTAQYDTAQAEAQRTAQRVNDIRLEADAIKGARMEVLSNGSVVDYRRNTIGRDENGNIDQTMNGNLSGSAVAELQRVATQASARSAANPGDVRLSNAAIIAHAANYAAIATQAQANAAADPNNPALAAAAAAAHADAVTAEQVVQTLVASNPNDHREVEMLNTMRENATDALNRINNGLTGRSISNISNIDIPNAKDRVHHTGIDRQRAFAESLREPSNLQRVLMPILGDSQLARDVRSHKIRQGAKEKH